MISERQTDDVRLFDAALSGVLNSRYDEVGHCPPLQLCRTLEHCVQISADSSFETSSRNGGGHDENLLDHQSYGNLPYTSTVYLHTALVSFWHSSNPSTKKRAQHRARFPLKH